MLKRLEDPDWSVRHQLAASIGLMPAASRDPAVVSLLERSGDDPITVDATLSGLRGSEAALLERLLQASPTFTPQRDAAAVMLAATLVRSGQEAGVQKLLTSIADEARLGWQRAAMLRGAEVRARRHAAGHHAAPWRAGDRERPLSDLSRRTRRSGRRVRVSAGAQAAPPACRRCA